jgi:hypothetical protein
MTDAIPKLKEQLNNDSDDGLLAEMYSCESHDCPLALVLVYAAITSQRRTAAALGKRKRTVMAKGGDAGGKCDADNARLVEMTGEDAIVHKYGSGSLLVRTLRLLRKAILLLRDQEICTTEQAKSRRVRIPVKMLGDIYDGGVGMMRCNGESHKDLSEEQYEVRRRVLRGGLLQRAMKKHNVKNPSWIAFFQADDEIDKEQLLMRLVASQQTGNFYPADCRCSSARRDLGADKRVQAQAVARHVRYLRLFRLGQWGEDKQYGPLKYKWKRNELKINAGMSDVEALCKAVLKDTPDAGKVQEFLAFSEAVNLYTYEAHNHVEQCIGYAGLRGDFERPEQALYKAAFRGAHDQEHDEQ